MSWTIEKIPIHWYLLLKQADKNKIKQNKSKRLKEIHQIEKSGKEREIS